MSNKTSKLPLHCLLRKVCYVLFSKRSYKNYLQANWHDWLISVAHSFCPILNPYIIDPTAHDHPILLPSWSATPLILRPTITPFYSHPDPHPIDAHNHPVLLPSRPPPHWCPQPPSFTPILTPLMPTTTPFYSHPDPHPIDAHNHPVLLTSWPIDPAHHRAWTQLMVGWVLLYVHRNRRLIRDGSPGRPPRLSHSSWAL